MGVGGALLGRLGAGLAAILAAILAVAAAPVAADARFGPDVRDAIIDHFQARLDSELCVRYFHYEGAQIVNWTSDDAIFKVEVVFFVSFISDQGLYRDSSLATYCLGVHRGSGFFERSKFYRSGALIYTLSKWHAGWHVDRVEAQP